MQFKSWLEWLYPCTIMRKLSALFDIGDHQRQDLENCDEDSVENKEEFEDDSRTSGFERGELRDNDEEEEEEEDYYEMVEPPDGQYFEAVNEIYAEIEGGYKRDLSASASSTSESGDSSSEDGNAIVTAKPAIVLEDQLDSLSYVGYDDIAGNVRSGLSKGGLYEDIAGSILNLARMKSGGGGGGGGGGGSREDIAKDGEEIGDNPDEMLSYTLAKLSEASNNSAADSGDKSSDEWVDLDDEEETDDYDSAERLVRNKGLVR